MEQALSTPQIDFRPDLLDRREKLLAFSRSRPEDESLSRLLAEVDAALDRLEAGTFGYCETCHDPIEPERLAADPLARFCLGDMSPEEQRALEDDLAEIEVLVDDPGVVAVGETGLDYFRTRDEEGRRAQERSFRSHIRWAHRSGKTLMIHDRDAHADILRVVDDEGVPDRMVMHCFSGDAAFAEQCVARGAFLSFPGVVTFGSAGALREAAVATPLDRILVETDAPYLTPKPQRGKANAPYLLPHTVRFLAELLGVELARFCDLVVANTFAAYGRWGSDA